MDMDKQKEKRIIDLLKANMKVDPKEISEVHFSILFNSSDLR